MSAPVSVNGDACVGCGLCAEICPTSQYTMQGGKAAVSGEGCIACGQCEAACPAQALRVLSLDEDPVEYATLSSCQEWIPYGEPDSRSLVALMRSRRSCRRFLDAPVDAAVLRDLAQIGASAPSGTSSQVWTFTILPDRAAVLRLVEDVYRFFSRVNRLAAVPLLRLISRLAKGELNAYYERYYATVEQAMDVWRKDRRDRLFFHAPAVMLIGSKPGGSTPAEDAFLAAQNILLAAHAMGLGTCLIGFAAAALKLDRGVRERAGVPEGERIHAVIAIGHTDLKYVRTTRRRRACVRMTGSSSEPGCCRASHEE